MLKSEQYSPTANSCLFSYHGKQKTIISPNMLRNYVSYLRMPFPVFAKKKCRTQLLRAQFIRDISDLNICNEILQSIEVKFDNNVVETVSTLKTSHINNRKLLNFSNVVPETNCLSHEYSPSYSRSNSYVNCFDH